MEMFLTINLCTYVLESFEIELFISFIYMIIYYLYYRFSIK